MPKVSREKNFNGKNKKRNIYCEFQLLQLVKFLIVE